MVLLVEGSGKTEESCYVLYFQGSLLTRRLWGTPTSRYLFFNITTETESPIGGSVTHFLSSNTPVSLNVLGEVGERFVLRRPGQVC